MKTIGILGGVGPETTSKVYLSIIDSFKKSGENKYPAIVIYNLPFPFSIENEAIVEGINSHKMIPYLVEGAKILERAGADFIILPCNTLHKYVKEIREAVKIPFLSILDETVSQLKLMGIETVGILATETTVKEKLYEDVLIKNNVKFLYPAREEQNDINRIIVELLNGEQNKDQKKVIKETYLSLQNKGSQAILLACTDLQIITSDFEMPISIIDSTEILIQASTRELSGK